MTVDRGRVHLIAEIHCAEGTASRVADLLSGYRDRVRQEPGNLEFAPGADLGQPGTFWVYEVYTDVQSFENHLKSEHNRAFNAAIDPLLLNGGTRLRMLTPLTSSGAHHG